MNFDKITNCKNTNPYAEIINVNKTGRYFSQIEDRTPSLWSFKAVPIINKGIRGSKNLKNIFVNLSSFKEIFEDMFGLKIPNINPNETPTDRAISLDKSDGILNEKQADSLLLPGITFMSDKLNPEFKNTSDTKYESIVFVKFEKQIRGTIINIYFIALAPSLDMELKTNENITKGNIKIKISLIDKLIE